MRCAVSLSLDSSFSISHRVFFVKNFFRSFQKFFPSVWPLSQATHLLYQTRSLLSTPFFSSSGRFLFLVVSFRPRFPASQALSSELVYITTPPPLMSTPFSQFFELFLHFHFSSIILLFLFGFAIILVTYFKE